MSGAEQVLLDKGLRKTPCRVFVLNEFLRSGKISLSELDLEKKARKKFDRVTIYRTLKTFQEEHILHKVIDDENLVKYAFCHHQEHHEHDHEHVHFKCEKCQKTECLEEVKVNFGHLPKGYSKSETNILVLGFCPQCQ